MRPPRALVQALALASVLAGRADAQGASVPDTILVRSGDLALRALLWRPTGPGPFPAVLFSHGSGSVKRSATGRREERDRARQPEVVGPVFARHGYAFFYLFRRGSVLSAGQGTYSGDLMDSAQASGGVDARNRVQLRLLETDEMRDALAGLATLRALPDVDARRIAVVGHSFGGSLTLLLAERDTSVRSVILFGAAANSWPKSPPLRARLLAAARHVAAPVLLIHAANDYSIAPAEALGAELARLGKPHRVRIYPPVGRTAAEGHGLAFLGVPTWERDVFAFLDESMRR